jgi:hypothetical protein
MNFLNHLDSVKMVDSRVQSNLIHHHDTSFLDFWFKGLDGVGDVRCSHYVTFMFDGALDDGYVVGVWNEGDDEVVF